MITVRYQPLSEGELRVLSQLGKFSDQILTNMIRLPVTYSYTSMDELTFEIKMRNNIIASAFALHQSQASFATFYRSRCNEDYWILTDEGGFELKHGTRSSEAISDIFTHGEKYAFECATAMMIIFFKALIDTIPPAQFDQLYQQIYLWDWHLHPSFPVRTESLVSDGVLGDVRYFKNPDVDPKTPQWQGENAVQLPENLFYGHGIGILKADQIVDELNENRFAGSERSAYLMDNATRPDFNGLWKATSQINLQVT